MALIPLKIPAGVVKNGTVFQQANSWNDANLVRWHEGTMQPVGGWRARTSTQMDGVCRALITYVDNSSNRRTVAGTNTKLYVIDEAGTVTDITPVGFTTGNASGTQNLGFGGLTFGTYAFGVPRPDTGTYGPCDTWSLDTWGEYALGCATSDGKIYQWANSTAAVAAVLSNAPTSVNAIVVTPERFVFALGAGGVGNKVQWCDQEANNTWTAAATNQAGDFTLNTGGNLMIGQAMRGETLLITDSDAHVARYAGPPFVFGFTKVGDGCGAISNNACVIANDSAFWMSNHGFHVYNGALQALRCSVGDYVFSNLTEAQRSKVVAVHNSQFNEVWWFYPHGATENNAYVAYNYSEGHWTIGTLARTAGDDSGVFLYPNMVTADGYIYEHEVGFDYDSETVFAETGPVEIGNGDRLMVARELIGDEKTLGDVTATFKTRLYPNASESSHGPYTLSTPTSVRFQGRQVSMRVTSAKATDWRVGTMRLDVVAGSKR